MVKGGECSGGRREDFRVEWKGVRRGRGGRTGPKAWRVL